MLLALLSITPFRAPASAQSGVLLGLHTTAGYETLWISMEGGGGSPALLARGEGLLVPRADGFWRVGVVPILETDTISVSRIVASPAADWARAVDAARADLPQPEGSCLRSEGSELVFLSPSYLSRYRHYNDEGCGTGATQSGIEFGFFEDLAGQFLYLGNLLDPGARTAFERAPETVSDSARGLDRLMHRGEDEAARREGAGCYSRPRDWRIRRGPGRWVVSVWTEYDSDEEAVGCMGVSFDLPMRLPEALTGHDVLFPRFEEVTRVFPTARDAVSSPRRDLLVALTPDTMYVTRIVDGRIRGSALSLPLRADLVMAQWALGSHVQRWTAELATLLGPPSNRLPRAYASRVATRVLTTGPDGARQASGDVVLVGSPAYIGFELDRPDSTFVIEDVRIDDRRFDVVPDTAQAGLRLHSFLVPRFLAVGPGRYAVEGQVGWGGTAARLPLRHEFIAIDYARGNDTTAAALRPDVQFSIPEGGTGVPVDYLARLDFSEPVRGVRGRIHLTDGVGNPVAVRLVGVGVGNTPGSAPPVYPNLDVADPAVLIRSVTLVPEEPLEFDTEYEVTIDPGILDADAPFPRPLVSPDRKFRFRTFAPRLRTLSFDQHPTAMEVGKRGTFSILRDRGEETLVRLRTFGLPTSVEIDGRASWKPPGQVRGLAIADRGEGRSLDEVVVVGAADSLGGSTLFFFEGEYADVLPLRGRVPLPAGTRLAALTALGPDIYAVSDQGTIYVVGVLDVAPGDAQLPADGAVATTIPPASPETRVRAIAAADLVVDDGAPRPLLVTVGVSPLLAVTDPATGRVIGTQDIPGMPAGGERVALGFLGERPVAVVGGATDLGGRGWVAAFDLTDPRHPVLLSSVILGAPPGDVLIHESMVVASADSQIRFFRLDGAGLRRLGVLDGPGGAMRVMPGGVFLLTTQSEDTTAIGVLPLAPIARAFLQPPIFQVDKEGRMTDSVTIGYQMTDPPPTGAPFFFILDNATTIARIPVPDLSPGYHAIPLPPDISLHRGTMSHPDQSNDVAVFVPGQTEAMAFWTHEDLVRSFPTKRLRAASQWDFHVPLPEPRPVLDSVAPLVATRGTPLRVRLYGTSLDRIEVHGWVRRPGDSARYEQRRAQSFPAMRDSLGTLVVLPDSLTAEPGLLTFSRSSKEVPLLVIDPTLPPLEPEAQREEVHFSSVPEAGGNVLHVTNPEISGTLVLGRGATPGFTIPGGFIPNFDLGRDTDMFFAVLSADRKWLAGPIPVDDQFYEDAVYADARPSLSDLIPEGCSEALSYAPIGDPPNGIAVTVINALGSRMVELVGVGLREGMRVVFRSSDREASVRLRSVQSLGPFPEECKVGSMELQRARAIYPMAEEPGFPYLRIGWVPPSAPPGRRP